MSLLEQAIDKAVFRDHGGITAAGGKKQLAVERWCASASKPVLAPFALSQSWLGGEWGILVVLKLLGKEQNIAEAQNRWAPGRNLIGGN